MGKKFVIELYGEPSEKLAKIKAAAAKKYVSFEGDINEGYFSGGTALGLFDQRDLFHQGFDNQDQCSTKTDVLYVERCGIGSQRVH